MFNKRYLPLIAIVAAASLFTAACSSDDDDSAGTTTETTADEAMTEEAMTEEGPGTIVDVAVADGRFTTLVTAVEAAGLVETLSGEGPYTVFAPTDDAFAALPDGTLEALLADPDALSDILTYHVVSGEVMASSVVELDGKAVETVNGETITVGVSDGDVTLTDATGRTANVIITDVVADNGVIHVIDAVLLPSA